ncbi:MAG: biopolymer transporter ExbD [Deltaproteobacteria bacterium]|jgi:biopolymer transport protein ExbD|nr:biopolymer transporter ExbD [Deltaproteobacteria bacterium]
MQNSNDDNDSDGLSSISDINVTPFIDVMLVLLIIFMVTAPLMIGGVKINLPKTTGLAMARPDKPLIVSLDANSQVFVDKDPLTDDQRASVFKRLALESETGEVFVRGDGEVKYAKMMELMSELGQAGFARVTLVTNVLPGDPAQAAEAAPATGQGAAPADSAAPPAAAPESSPAPPSAPAQPAEQGTGTGTVTGGQPNG